MTFTHALSTNRYGEADLIVSTSAANGTHTTLASAISAAVSGQTIFLRDSVTENVTLTPGVNIAAWSGGSLNSPTITGTVTMTGAGTSMISGIRLATNSAAIIAVTGSAASILNLNNCYLNCSNNTGITFSTSSPSGRINITDCAGDLGTTGIAYFTHTSAGTINIINSSLGNSGVSTTASTASAGNCVISYSTFLNAVTTSSTAAINYYRTRVEGIGNTIALTHGGSGANSGATYSSFSSGTASGVSIGTGATFNMTVCDVVSSNTNAVTGIGTLNNSGIFFPGTSSVMNTTTINGFNLDVGGISFDNGANNLNVYKVGTWTPTIVGGSTAGVTTYSVQQGYYTKTGNQVTLWAVVVCSAATGTGDVNLAGFPFTIKNQTNGNAQGIVSLNGSASIAYPAARTWVTGVGATNTVLVVLTAHGTAVSSSNVQMANTTWNLQPTISYQV